MQDRFGEHKGEENQTPENQQTSGPGEPHDTQPQQFHTSGLNDPARTQEIYSARPEEVRGGDWQANPHEGALRKGERKLIAWVAVALIAVTILAAVVIIQAAFKRRLGPVPELPSPRPVAAGEAPSPTELSNSFRAIARTVKPAVVNINVIERASQESGFPDIFGFPNPRTPRGRPGTGSGFIVTDDGYIVTNNHVVENAQKIEVTLSDNRKYKATVIGTDPETDLAVIKIDADGLPVAVLGDSDQVQQGDWVLALGSPFGLQQTLTAGIVSATGRELQGPQGAAQLGKFIQTDASINPGNSGGPLVGMNGEVVGINTMIVSPPGGTGGSVGIGFAVASNVARDVFAQLVKGGKVTRGYLGVLIGPLDEPVARSLGLTQGEGVLVSKLTDPESPAAKAGIKTDDVITAINGKPVKTPRELIDIVAATPVGDTVTLDVIREGEPMTFKVEVAERPAQANARPEEPEPAPERGMEESRLGISAQTVSPEMAQKLRIPSGAMVLKVQPGSLAASAGIRHGDVIHRIDTTDVKSAEDLIRAAQSLKEGDEIAIRIERNGELNWVRLTIE